MAETPSRETGFLSRWSRLKRESVQPGPREPAPPPAADAGAKPPAEAGTATAPTLEHQLADQLAEARARVPELPPIESVSLASDFTPFMQRKVPEILRRQALKALFRDPHFNQMDGLDIYIDDYTQFEPIPEDMLDKLSAWRAIQKPLEHVVSPEGHAVDVESEEGRAILAARKAAEREVEPCASEPAQVAEATSAPGRVSASPADAPPALASPEVPCEVPMAPPPESEATAQPMTSTARP